MSENQENQNPQSSGVFVVHTRFPSPNKQDGAKELSDKQVRIDYTFTKETRNKISAIVTRHKSKIYTNTLTFPPGDDGNPNVLRLCRGDQIPEISKEVAEADKELQIANNKLHYATCSFFPINIYEIQKGELYGQIVAAIRYQILKEAIDRIGEKAGQLDKRGKKAIDRMVERMRAINIFNDPAIDKMLADTHEKIITQDVAEVRKSLESELHQLSQRAAFIDL